MITRNSPPGVVRDKPGLTLMLEIKAPQNISDVFQFGELKNLHTCIAKVEFIFVFSFFSISFPGRACFTLAAGVCCIRPSQRY